MSFPNPRSFNDRQLLPCMPYNPDLPIAKTAYELGIHYFDLTEDVPTTAAIREIARDSKGIMAPQCGLAPGFIGIVGANLAAKFTSLLSYVTSNFG